MASFSYALTATDGTRGKKTRGKRDPDIVPAQLCTKDKAEVSRLLLWGLATRWGSATLARSSPRFSSRNAQHSLIWQVFLRATRKIFVG